MKPSLYSKLRDGAVVLALVVMMGVLLRTVLAAGDRNRVCVDNTFAVTRALAGYVQDYDERFPYFMGDAAAVRQYVGLYIVPRNAAVFFCPATKNTPYVFNAALNNVAFAAIESPSTTPTMQDGKPHPDGKLTVGFADSHVERGGQIQLPPNSNAESTCAGYARQVNLALQMYAQDYDETLPPFVSNMDLEGKLLVYMRSENYKFLCPATLAPRNYNPVLSGKPLAAFPDYSVVETVKDSLPHPKDGKLTLVYLDGHTARVSP